MKIDRKSVIVGLVCVAILVGFVAWAMGQGGQGVVITVPSVTPTPYYPLFRGH